VIFGETNHNLDVLYQLQTTLDRATFLYSLEFLRLPSTSIGLPPFELSSKSIRRLCIQEIDEFYDTQQYLTLSRSPLSRQCEVLSISVEKRTNIIDLLNAMPNLRALNIIFKDDDENLSSKDDKLVKWLKHRLPSMYTVTRINDYSTKGQSFTTFQPVRLWLIQSLLIEKKSYLNIFSDKLTAIISKFHLIIFQNFSQI
jgi:hypothetical protein